jgi:exopolysaccharide production protein ExoZ
LAYTAFVTWAFPANSSLQINTTFGIHGWPRLATWGVAGWLLAAGTVFLSTGLQAKRGSAEAGPLSRVAIFLGDASYSIYLSSALTMEQLGRVMQYVHPLTVPSQILISSTTVLSTLMVVLVGCLFHVGIERPLTTWLHREMHSRPFGMARLPVVQTP